MARRQILVLGAIVVVASGIAASPGDATPFLPVGSGAWSSTNVTTSSGCAHGPITGAECTVDAKSFQNTPAAGETCTNASYVLTTPVIVGTSFGCTATFTATLTTTTSGGEDAETGDESLGTRIETGACAGFTLRDATLVVHDHAVGDYEIDPKVTVTPVSWTIEGQLVGLDATTTKAYVLHVVAKIAPGCTTVRARRGETQVQVTGVFSGSYQFL